MERRGGREKEAESVKAGESMKQLRQSRYTCPHDSEAPRSPFVNHLSPQSEQFAGLTASPPGHRPLPPP